MRMSKFESTYDFVRMICICLPALGVYFLFFGYCLMVPSPNQGLLLGEGSVGWELAFLTCIHFYPMPFSFYCWWWSKGMQGLFFLGR